MDIWCWCSCFDCETCMRWGMAYPECYENLYLEEWELYESYGYY